MRTVLLLTEFVDVNDSFTLHTELSKLEAASQNVKSAVFSEILQRLQSYSVSLSRDSFYVCKIRPHLSILIMFPKLDVLVFLELSESR